MVGALAAAQLLHQAQDLLIAEGRSPAAIRVVGLLRLAAEVRAVAADRELAVTAA